MSSQNNNLKRRPLVVGNWKLNGNQSGNQQLVAAIVAQRQAEQYAEVALCPPYVYMTQVAEHLHGAAVKLGAQDASAYAQGAYTGEVSAAMLADIGCQYVIVGHSERRHYFGESNEQVAQKFIAVQAAGLTPILCVGESLDDRDSGHALSTIAYQVEAVLAQAGLDAFAQAVIAYEPIWAVGTGRIASPQQVEEVHHYIRQLLGEYGDRIRILYGGSVKPDNAGPTFALPDVDGALIGGASLIAEDFVAICQQADAKH